MPLLHSGPSTLRVGTMFAALLVASVAIAQTSTVGSAPETGTSPVVVPQAPAAATPIVTAPVIAQPDATAQAATSSAEGVPAPAATVESGTPATMPVETTAPANSAAVPASAEPSAPEALAPTVTGEAAESVAVEGSLPHDLSPIGMFMAADWIVKGVMLALGFASLVTWTVWLAKTLQLFGARARANRGLKAVIQAKSLKDVLAVLEKRGGVVASMVRAAQHEMTLSDGAIDRAGGEGVKERVASALGRIEVRAGRQMSKGTGVLASIGSTAPFVGLFGTVWGIMNSFIGIAETQTTNLAVVAPGIAEALLATAVGLVAAIPAVIIYNVFARSVTGYRQLVSDAAAGIERLVSRDLDFRKSALSVRVSNLQAAE